SSEYTCNLRMFKLDSVLATATDHLSSAIGKARTSKYQATVALVNHAARGVSAGAGSSARSLGELFFENHGEPRPPRFPCGSRGVADCLALASQRKSDCPARRWLSAPSVANDSKSVRRMTLNYPDEDHWTRQSPTILRARSGKKTATMHASIIPVSRQRFEEREAAPNRCTGSFQAQTVSRQRFEEREADSVRPLRRYPSTHRPSP